MMMMLMMMTMDGVNPSGCTDTLLEEPDITEKVEKIISFAPGEGNRPPGIFIDKLLSFPTLFGGQTRADNKDRATPVHYRRVCRWELKRSRQESCTIST